jgi:ABC-type multidrug transport system fused ATPase/permease subunit
LDPFDQNDDATLNDALCASGLFSLQTAADEAGLTLDSEIASGGNNLSVGQRQIIALARAIVRNSRLLIWSRKQASKPNTSAELSPRILFQPAAISNVVPK